MNFCTIRTWRDSILLAVVWLTLPCDSAWPQTSPPDPFRPGAVSVEEVPPLRASTWERLRQYQAVRNASFLGWSPDGHGILIATRFGDTNQLHRVYQPGGRREQITFFKEPVTGEFVQDAARGGLLLTMNQGGSEDDQVYYLDPDSGLAHLHTDGKSRNLLGPQRWDGAEIIIHSNQRNARDTDLYIARTRQPGSLKLLMQVENEHWTATDWSRDGRQLLLQRYVSINESYAAILDIASQTRKPRLLPGDTPAACGPMIFSADGKSVYIATDVRGEFRELARMDLDQGQVAWLTADIPWDVTSLELDPGTGRVALTTNEDGGSALYLLDGDQRRRIETPLGTLGGVRFSPDGRQLGFTLGRPDAPADAWSCDLSTGELTQWTFSEAGGLRPDSFVTAQRIQFPSFDQRQIPAYYFRPRSASADHKAPVLINIHGGPESQYRPLFSGLDQFHCSELGLAVIHPNVRGSAGYGKTYLKLDNAELREDSVRDIGALLDWIAQQPELDASRVAVMGGSYGGYMVLASLTNYGDRIRAGVDVVGIASFRTFLKNTSSYRQDLRRAEYGDERDPRMQSFFDRIDPLANAGKIRSALLVAHGKNDPRVPFSEALQIAARVREQGRPVWTVYADNEGHGFSKKPNRDYLNAVVAEFLKSALAIEVE